MAGHRVVTHTAMPTLGDVVRQHRRSRPTHTAVVDGDVRLTWPQLDDRVNRLAAAFAAAGVQPGGRVLWLGQNSHRLLESLLAAAKLGAVCCLANWRQSADELAWLVDDVDPAVVIWQQAEIGDTVRSARTREPARGEGRWICHDDPGPEGYEAFLARRADDPTTPVDPGSPVLMLYTAAFAGKPNGALLSHAALVAEGMVMAMAQEITPAYVYLNCGPLFHVATLMTTLATFVMGGTNVFTPRTDATELCRLIDAERCTGAFVIGPTINQVLDVNRDGRWDLSSLRTFGGSAAWNAMITVDTSPWGTRPAGYGQTEVTGMLTLNAWADGQIGTSGRPHPFVEMRVVDPDGNEVPAGETGEIVARGTTVMVGYHDRPALDAERRRDGWHHTNDLGRIEADGSLTFVAPKGRLIKSAAENIYPAEVEQCLAAHPAVAEAAVIGVPDRTWGQNVKAIVVVARGASTTADELIAHCRAHLASYKKPKSVELVDALPKHGWRVDYDALDSRFGGGGYPGEPGGDLRT